MATVHECACLAEDVYNVPANLNALKGKNYRSGPPNRSYKFLQSWIGLPDYGSKDWGRISEIFNSASGFFARLYCNQLTNETVIAYRGTVPNIGGTWIADYELGINRWGTEDQATLDFYEWVAQYIAYMNKHKGKNYRMPFQVVGHSLGGFLAQIIAIKYPHVEAYVFNSPGIGGLFCSMHGFRIPGLNGPVNPNDPSYKQRIFHYDLDTDAVHRLGVLVGSEREFSSPNMICTIAETITSRMGLNPSGDIRNVIYATAALTSTVCIVSTEHSIDTLNDVLAKDPVGAMVPQ